MKIKVYQWGLFALLIGFAFMLQNCQENEIIETDLSNDELIEIGSKGKQDKILMCHYDELTDTWKTLSINGNALSAHLNHGDTEGECSTTTIPTVTSPTGKIWMDRNLGATQVATSSNDANSYGDLYQWGRGTDGHQIRTPLSTSAGGTSASDTPGHGNFILVSADPYDWRDAQNDDLWQPVTGVNNPCPTGFRIPTFVELDAERASWTPHNAAGAFASPLKLPVAGVRWYGDGSIDGAGDWGFYWTSSVDHTNSFNLTFNSFGAELGSWERALGMSVRCIKD